MPSASGTPNLGLRQWTLDDPFLMEEMNENNRKIDQALSSNPWERIIDITVEEPVNVVEVDLTGIDLTRYLMLKLFYPCEKSVNTNIRFNGLTDGKFFYYSTNGSWTGISYMYFSSGQAEMDLMDNNLFTENPFRIFKSEGMTVDGLNTMQFYKNASSYTFHAGDKIVILGVKR